MKNYMKKSFCKLLKKLASTHTGKKPTKMKTECAINEHSIMFYQLLRR